MTGMQPHDSEILISSPLRNLVYGVGDLILLDARWVTQHNMGALFQESTNVETLDGTLGETLLTNTLEGRGYFGFADSGGAEENDEYSVRARLDILVFQARDKISFTSLKPRKAPFATSTGLLIFSFRASAIS